MNTPVVTDPADGLVLRVGPDLGFSVLGVFDLPTPDDRGIPRFSLDLADFLMLVFEHWCPPAAGTPPFVDPHTLAHGLGAAWAAVWFPRDGRVATVTPLFAQPWLRIVGEAWPVCVQNAAGDTLPVVVWPDTLDPPDGDSRWIRIAVPQGDMAAPSPVELKLRPDKARGGRIRMEIKVSVDLFEPPTEQHNATIRTLHRARLQQWLLDLRFYYPPAFWQTQNLDEPCPPSDSAVAIEHAAVRLLERIENHDQKTRDSRWNRGHRWLEWLYSRLSQHLESLGKPALAAETTLSIVSQRLGQWP